ncbi:MAG: VOC family protein [Ruminococcaceae bacterium]|nr:VOC family protein [Oscillospiraceae bacterium]
MKLRAACIQTHHADALVAFYTQVFGRPPHVDGDVDYQFAAEQLTIFRLAGATAPATQSLALIFTVDDVDSAYTRLDALGLCNGALPTNKPWGVHSFVITDPDGNTVSFTKAIA